jgi:hypothetical protein
MASDQQKREYIRDHLDSDLHFLLEDAGVALTGLYAIAQLYRTVKHFSALGDDRAEVRKACKDDFGIDPAAGAVERSQVASIVTAWEASKEYVVQENKIKAESRALGVAKPLANTDRAAMRKAVEAAFGKKHDYEMPSPEYIAHKMEEIELNEVQASPLDEITSMEDINSTSLQSSVDNDGRIRVVKVKSKGTLPQNSEQLRVKYRIETNAWLMLASKFKQKTWLNQFDGKCFEVLTEYILGPKVFNVQIPQAGSDALVALHPAWTVILRYEFELRKDAFKRVRDDGLTLTDAILAVIKDPELKEIFFTSPIALARAARTTQLGLDHQEHKHPRREDPPRTIFKKGDAKGDSKGKRGGGRGKGKGKKLLTTPDGRQICFKFNNGNCPGNCGRVHVCQIKGCLGQHAAKDHGKEQAK